MKFIAELRRRNVVKVGALRRYRLGLDAVADVMFPALNLSALRDLPPGGAPALPATRGLTLLSRSAPIVGDRAFAFPAVESRALVGERTIGLDPMRRARFSIFAGSPRLRRCNLTERQGRCT
jgi:hypothetical protein